MRYYLRTSSVPKLGCSSAVTIPGGSGKVRLSPHLMRYYLRTSSVPIPEIFFSVTIPSSALWSDEHRPACARISSRPCRPGRVALRAADANKLIASGNHTISMPYGLTNSDQLPHALSADIVRPETGVFFRSNDTGRVWESPIITALYAILSADIVRPETGIRWIRPMSCPEIVTVSRE